MKTSAPHGIFKSLTLRMFVPVVLIICAVGVALYFFVLRAVSEFAEQEIRETLALTAKEIYGICDKNFTELMQSGRMNDSKAVRIKRALTLGAIEDYSKRYNINFVLYEKGHKALVYNNVDRKILKEIEVIHSSEEENTFRYKGTVYYFHHFDFRPWGFHFGLVNDTAFYAPLVNRVKMFYGLTAAFLMLGLVLLLFTLERSMRNPIRRIINAMREKRPPDYRGISELEFLSSNIAGMMASLKERTAWLERLYMVGSANRGERFFNSVARVIADAMAMCVVITRKGQKGGAFNIMTFAEIGDGPLRREHLDGDLPCEMIAQTKEPTVVLHQAARHFSSFRGIVESGAESYIGLPIFDREGRITGCVHMFGSARDVDDWDMNFVKTAGQMVSLEFELMEKEQEQEQVREQMFRAQKLESMGLLAGGVAHDFNNLLMGIQGRASLMLGEGKLEPAHYQHLEAIEEYVRSAAELTRQLLGFARGGKYDVKPADINEVLEHSAQMFGRTKKEITILNDFAPDLWNTDIDRRQIEQVFLNLFVNAWQAMPGGGKLMLKTENVVLTETDLKGHHIPPGRYVKISVSDTGVGMSEETMKKIFDPFYTTREMRRGTGLGLASVYGIIKNHEGLIDVQSRIGRGTTFTICLKASDKEVEPELKADTQLMKGDGTVLLVDDEEMIIEVGGGMLEKLGYRVLLARSGRQALELFQENRDKIQLVIMDMIMPEMSGGETFDRLLKIQPAVKVLLSSGYSLDEQAQAILNRGCRGFIQKPFSITDLSAKIRNILQDG